MLIGAYLMSHCPLGDHGWKKISTTSLFWMVPISGGAQITAQSQLPHAVQSADAVWLLIGANLRPDRLKCVESGGTGR